MRKCTYSLLWSALSFWETERDGMCSNKTRSRNRNSIKRNLLPPCKLGTVLLVATAETALRTREARCLQAGVVWSNSDVRPMMRHCSSWVSTSLSTLAGCLQSWRRTWKGAGERVSTGDGNTLKYKKVCPEDGQRECAWWQFLPSTLVSGSWKVSSVATFSFLAGRHTSR